MQKVSLVNRIGAMDERQWRDFFQDIEITSSQKIPSIDLPNTEKIYSMPTRELEDFTLEQTICLPVTISQEIVVPQETLPCGEYKMHHLHDLLNASLLIDTLIDQYADQGKIVKLIHINPLISLLLSRTTQEIGNQDYYIFRGTMFIELIINPLIPINAVGMSC
jgi:hypothetical protein